MIKKRHELQIFTIVLLMVIIFPFSSVTANNCHNDEKVPIPSQSTNKIKVVTTITILEDFVKNVGGDHVDVYSLVSGSEDPHTYEPSPSETQKLVEADILFLMGREGLEPYWNGSFGQTILSSNLDLIVVSAMNSSMIENDAVINALNPHGWTNPLYAKMMIENIYNALFTLNSANSTQKTEFTTNFASYGLKLDNLYSEVIGNKTIFNGTKVVMHHPAMKYLYDLLGIVRVAVIEEKEGSEPSAQHIQEITKTMIDDGLTIIVNQPNLDVEDVGQIAKDANAKIVNSIPLLGMTGDNGELIDNYIEMIRYNIWALNNPQDPPEASTIDGFPHISVIFGFGLMGILMVFLKKNSKNIKKKVDIQ
jgi:ABC-type Zn uptake system ZnuABC Zn-binding protein ZnuA